MNFDILANKLLNFKKISIDFSEAGGYMEALKFSNYLNSKKIYHQKITHSKQDIEYVLIQY